MAKKQEAPIQRFSRKTVDQFRDQQAPDRDLLNRFALHRDEEAFAALVRRHGAMVLGVGLRVLRHRQDAEDVRQATFLLLARKVHAVPWRDSIASWLYTAAYHLALQSRDAANRRSARASKVRPKPPPDALADISLRELQGILDEELSRLPKKYSAPLLLCCLEGKARDEAAQCLGWPLAMLKSRLEDGRERLRRRLARRGLELATVLAGVALTSGVGSAAVPATLVRATSSAALQILGGKMTAGVVSANVMALVKGAVLTMVLTKLKVATVLLLAAGAVATGVIALANNAPKEARAQTPAKTPAPPNKPGELPAGALTRLGDTRWRHGGTTGFVAFAPDGKSVVSASTDQVLHLWKFPSGEEIRHFGPGVNGPVPPAARFALTELPVALSADGKTAACHFEGAELLVFDVATGNKLASLPRPGKLSHVALSPDGRYLADRDWIGKVTIWDWKAGTSQVIDARHKHVGMEVPSLTYAPDGNLLAMTENYADGTHHSEIILVDLRQPKGQDFRAILPDPPTYISAILFSPDGRLLASRGSDSVLYLFDVATGKQLRQIHNSEFFVSMAFSRDGHSVMTRSSSGQTVRAWDVASGKELRSFKLAGVSDEDAHLYRMHPRPALSPDGKIMALAGIDHALHFLDLLSGKETYGGKSNTVALSALGFAPDGKRLWAQGAGKSLRQWDWTSGREVEPIRVPVDTGRAALDVSAKYIVTAPLWDAKVGRIIRVDDGEEVGQVPPAQVKDDLRSGPDNMILSADGALLARRWERSQLLELYEIPSGKLRHAFSIGVVQPDGAKVSSTCWPFMLFSTEGQFLAAYSKPEVLSLWNTKTGQKRADLPLRGSRPLDAIAFAPDNRALAMEKSDGSVVLWELASHKVRRVFAPRTAPPPAKLTYSLGGRMPALSATPSISIAFSPNGDLLVHGAPDGAIHAWDVGTGAELAVFTGHTGVVNAFAFSADGKTLASASADTSVLTWDLSTLVSRPRARRVFTDAEVQSRWQVLVGQNAEKAYAAMCDLAAAPTQTVPFLNQHLKPAAALNLEQINRQLADLGDSAFKVREKAMAELLQLDAGVVPHIDEALAAMPSLEVQLRLKKIRDQLTSLLLTYEALRQSRAVEVLERIGTPEASRLLDRLAGGAPGALTTTSARAVLNRLAGRIK